MTPFASKGRFSVLSLLAFVTYIAIALAALRNAGIVRPWIDVIYVLLLFSATTVAASQSTKYTPFMSAFAGVALIHRLSKDSLYDGAFQYFFQGVGELLGTGMEAYMVGWDIVGISFGICGGIIAQQLADRTQANS